MFSRISSASHSVRWSGACAPFRRFASSSSAKYDVVVVGGGPGGYVAAIKAGQLGLKVACVESRGRLGGTCLNVGCIPSKALLNASHQYHEAHTHFSKIGIEGGEAVTINVETMMAYKNKAVDGLTKGIELLFKKNKVDYIKAFGTITGKNEVTCNITGQDGKPSSDTQTLQTDNIIIATGSAPATLPGLDVDEKQIVTSTGALELKHVPKTLIVVGGGVIGLEMGSVWSRLGSQVTVVEYLDRIVPGTDSEIATAFKRTLEKQKIKFKLGTKVVSSSKSDSGVTLHVEAAKGGNAEELHAEVVLVATGRVPYTANLGLDKLGVKMTAKKQIETDEHFRTSVPNIYAIGDVITGPMLAHKAEEEGIAAVEIIKGQAGHVNYNAIPGVIYTWPEVATVGQSEDEVKKSGRAYRVGKFPFMANSRARTNDDAEGMVKVVTDQETDRILGVHIMGPQAGELIGECVLAIEYGASAEDIARTCHAHPTLSEAVKEAAMQKPIHF